MKTIVSLLFSALLLATASAADQSTVCYEMRTYYAAKGKLEDLNARFRKHTVKLFEKHGMTNIGYWMPVDNTNNALIYILAHQSREAARRSWQAFGADPEWRAAAKASEIGGRLVTKAESVFLTPTDYSPAIQTNRAAEPRLFELRTYKAAPGKLAALNARFRNHTTALFKQHGMTNFAYWTPMDQDKGAEDTLIYIVIHKDRDAAEASWKAFRADQAWIDAKAASETEGPLTTKVQSIYLKPADYSLTK